MVEKRLTNIAVAVATVGRPDGLARCLSGVLAGTALPRELIVVDQDPQGSARIVVAGYEGHPAVSIRYVLQPPRGLSASRNAAWRLITSPILAVTDDDCLPEPGWLSAIDRAFHDAPLVGAITGPVLPLGPLVAGYAAVSSRNSMESKEYSGYSPPWQAGTGANMALRVEWLERVGGYDERLGAGSKGAAAEDVDLIYRLLRAGTRIAYEPRALVRHERQPMERRYAKRSAYGRGVGAFCGLLLKERDLTTFRILFDWIRLRLRLAAAGIRRRQWQRVCEEWQVLRGTFGGVGYGVSVAASPRSAL